MVISKVQDLRGLLSDSFGNDLEILDQKSCLLTAPGEHYGSIMLALQVTVRRKTGKEETLDLVAKLIPANAMLRVAFDVGVTFKKEIFSYMETIPTLDSLQKSYNIPEDEAYSKLFPKCYGARICLDPKKNTVDEDGVLIFENLKLQGYKTEDRLLGFDLQAAELIIKDLAQFHAVPLALKILKPQLFQEKVMPSLQQNKGLEQLPPEVGQAFHNSIMEGAKEWNELEPYWDRLQKIVDYVAIHPYVERPIPKDKYGSISHSDYWTSNTMILRDETGAVIKNKIVDLQIMSYSSIVRDLLFFMYTSVMNDVLSDHHDEFIRLYYDSFIDNLKKFDLDVTSYTWDDFLQELNEVAPQEVYHILIMLKPICTERGKVQNSLENFQDTDWSRKDLLGPAHRKKMRATVLELVKHNWI